jgi:predicted MarR family transcription regulator
MGSTAQSAVVKQIVHCVLSHDNYGKYTDIFTRVNWDDLKQTTKAFRKLIELLELEMAV